MTLSNSQITKLGRRLRHEPIDKEDLNLLDEFRQMFSDVDEQAYPMIQATLQGRTDYTLTKRKRKTQQSIVDKLKRQPKLRLPQMQDIAGCRIVVQGGSQAAQEINDILSGELSRLDWRFWSKERRTDDGYRAIHVIMEVEGKFYEIQLRAYAQDLWGNIVERLCDKTNSLKYGGNDKEQHFIQKLKKLSESFYLLDEEAHNVDFSIYETQIEDTINHVLSD
ncbi:MAG: hypothetical protein KGV50_03710 [Gammaproteobacteria bacterium]|nr:hypothetical protein [Gammaproteobacteria bacterium]